MKKKALTLRMGSALLCLLLCLTAFAACGNSEKESGSTAQTKAEEINLRFGWWGNQLRNDTTVAAINLYIEQNPGVKFESEFSDWSGYWDKMATQTASNNLPDIIQQDYLYIASYQAKNQLADLSLLVESGHLSLDNINESILESGTINDRLYALCSGMNAPCIIYNMDAVAEAGLTMPIHPTYEELITMSEKIYETNGMLGDLNMNGMTIQHAARNYGEQLYMGPEKKIGISKEHLLEAYNVTFESNDKPWQISMALATEKGSAGLEGSAISTGTTWLSIAHSNQLPAHQAASEDELGIAMMPKLSGATHESMFLKPGMFYCISERSAKKEDAAKFLDFLTHSKEAQDLLVAERGVPIDSEVAAHIKEKLEAPQQKAFDFVAEVEKIAVTIDPPFPPGATEAETLNETVLNEMRFGSITPEEAVDRFLAEGTEILTRAAQ